MPLLRDLNSSKRKAELVQSFTALGAGSSDLFKMLSAVGAYEYEPTVQFCQKHFLRPKAMQEIQQLRRQISNISKVDIGNLAPPNDTKVSRLFSLDKASRNKRG